MKKVYLVIDEGADPGIVSRVQATLSNLDCTVWCQTITPINGDFSWRVECKDSDSRLSQTDLVLIIPDKGILEGDDINSSEFLVCKDAYQRIAFAVKNMTEYESDEDELRIDEFNHGKDILVVQQASTDSEHVYAGVLTEIRVYDSGRDSNCYGSIEFNDIEINLNIYISPKQVQAQSTVQENVVTKPKEGKLKVYISKSNLADNTVYTNVRAVLRQFDLDIVEWDMSSSMPTRHQYDRMNACDILLVIPPKSTLSSGALTGDYKVGKGQHDMIVAFTDKTKIFAITMANDSVTLRYVLSVSTYESGDWKDQYAYLNLAGMQYLKDLLRSSINLGGRKNPVPTDESGKPVDTGYIE